MVSLILAAGTPGRRFVFQNSCFRIHKPHGALQGTASNVVRQANEIQNQKNKLIALYAIHLNRPVNEIANFFECDSYMNPEQALEFVLIDSILD
jgi:ATP-dependent Clp protease protease subunit